MANNGLKVIADAGMGALARADTIIVPGSRDIVGSPSVAMLDALRRAHRRGARIASICAGAFILAAAGLLDGRRATAHWAHTETLSRRYPRVQVDANVLYVDDGDIMTSAGRAAGLDLCLHIVRSDHGTEIANHVARRLVFAPHREGGQAQYIRQPVPRIEGDALAVVFDWAQRHLDRELTIASLAAKAHFIGLSMGSYSSLQVGLNAPERALSMTLAAVGSGSELEKLDAFRAQCRANAEQYEAIGSVEVAKVTREAPSRIPFLLKDPRGHADFYAALARHDARGSANTMRSFQGGRPSIYTMTDAIRKVPTPALILCGDEDDNCVGPSLFLKQHLPAAGLSFFPKAGHVLNLEEPALFNEMVERFIALVEAGRWPVRDPRSTVKVAV
jgi:proline iminopeptidase